MSGIKETKRVLVVDDDADVAAVVRRVLEAAGYSVRCVLDSSLAFKVIAEQSVDLIVTDLIMPDLDGAELIRRLRDAANATPVIAISGGGFYLTPDEALAVARKLRVTAVLKKPFTPAELLTCVDRAVGHRL